jgi:diguanylate cyclase (GGDEF)-like protein/hemerythrin-like metal-binding protein/PAS domain S-box-containing protein
MRSTLVPHVPTPKPMPAEDASLRSSREVIEKAGVGLAVLDLDGRFREANPAFCETVGYSRDELLSPGFELRQILLREEIPSHDEGLRALRRGVEHSYRKTMQLVRGDGGFVWVDWAVGILRESGTPQVLVTVIDLTEQKRVEDAFRHMSLCDPLTKLANRRLLEDLVQTAIARAQREANGVGLLFIDLDNFKPINDTLGHDVGDWLLSSVARRLADCLRAYDTAARFGGDEFVVLIPDLVRQEDALCVAERILASLAQPFVGDDGKGLTISASIGMSFYPDHAHTERELLHAGDEAMYLAKKAGRNRIVRSDRVIEASTVQRTEEEPHTGLVHLRWEAAYASGNVFIDAEHRELFRQSNQLLDLAMRLDAQPAGVRSCLQRLMRTVKAHFEHEERLLAEWAYPELADHGSKHRRMVERAEQIAHLMDDKSIPIGELLGFLIAEMVRGHILTEDCKYFYLLKQVSDGGPFPQ